MNIQLNSAQNSAYIAIKDGEYHVSKKIFDNVIVDTIKDGTVLGIEVLDISEKVEDPKKEISVAQKI